MKLAQEAAKAKKEARAYTRIAQKRRLSIERRREMRHRVRHAELELSLERARREVERYAQMEVAAARLDVYTRSYIPQNEGENIEESERYNDNDDGNNYSKGQDYENFEEEYD